MAESEIIYSGAFNATQFVGSTLRGRRKALGRTMKQVAEATGLSEGFISQIERDISVPSLLSLVKIAACLDTPVEFFVARNRKGQDISGLSVRTAVGANEDANNTSAVKDIDIPKRSIHSSVLELPVGWVSEINTFEGEAFVYVIEGALMYEVNGIPYRLKKGDTLHFPASFAHRVYNIGENTAEELFIEIS